MVKTTATEKKEHTQMRRDTIQRKKASKGFREIGGDDWLIEHMYKVMLAGKQAFDGMMLELGRMMAESIMYMEREELSGPDHSPKSGTLRKWASEPGSVYIGDQKVRVQRPRIRDTDLNAEIPLRSYQRMHRSDGFSAGCSIKSSPGSRLVKTKIQLLMLQTPLEFRQVAFLEKLRQRPLKSFAFLRNAASVIFCLLLSF